MLIEHDDLSFFKSKRRPRFLVQVIGIRNDSVEPVVSAGQLDDDEDLFGVLFFAILRIGCAGSRSKKRRHGAAKSHQGAGAKLAPEKLASG
ncbi:MAG: hypothetical protein WD176_05720 [Pirellulales bacterium]